MSRAALPAGPLDAASALAWVNRASRGRFNTRMVAAAVRHHSAVGTDPAILVHAAVVWLALGCERRPDALNQYWHLVDQVSAQTRSRYIGIDPEELLT